MHLAACEYRARSLTVRGAQNWPTGLAGAMKSERVGREMMLVAVQHISNGSLILSGLLPEKAVVSKVLWR